VFKHISLLIFYFLYSMLAANDTSFTITSNLPVQSGYYFTSSGTLFLENIAGSYDQATVQSITINGKPAHLEPGSGAWRIADDDSIALYPGINRITIQSVSDQDGTGNSPTGEYIDIWYNRDDFSQLGGMLNSYTYLSAQEGPWYITEDITVPSNVTLEIEAGATLFFNDGARLTIQAGGRLNAQGEQYKYIYLTKNPGNSARWRGIRFQQTLQDNIFAYASMTFGDSSSQIISANQSKLTIDHITWDDSTDKTVLEVDHPSVIVRNSVFPSVDGAECVHGADLTGSEYLVLENNVFHPVTGYNDIIDFSNCKRPGPILEIYYNTFLGGSDDGLDLDGCDAHVEGNIFQNFHKGHDGSSTSNAIATGEYNSRTSDITVVRNIFTDNDHAILLKEDCSMEAENNVFAFAGIAAINFGEPERDVTPGKGANLDGNIFYQNGAIFMNQFAQEGETDPVIIVNRCLIAAEFYSLGTENLDANPQFIDPENGDFRLSENSPANKTGPNGLDMGAHVAPGASISGEPGPTTSRTDAQLTINGPGIVSYRYVVNDVQADWSTEYTVANTPLIALESLVSGQTYTVFVQGKNSAGRWQSAPDYTTSKSWTVDIAAGIPKAEIQLPTRLTLRGYPNPFNPVITIGYTLPNNDTITLTVYDITGKKVTTLASGFQTIGSHSILWDGKDGHSIPVASGTYIIILNNGKRLISKKVTLIR
jgi:hypothetical protein